MWPQEGSGQWIPLDAEQVMENGVVVGTRNPTGDYLMLDCRFELPYGEFSTRLASSAIVSAYPVSFASLFIYFHVILLFRHSLITIN